MITDFNMTEKPLYGKLKEEFLNMIYQNTIKDNHCMINVQCLKLDFQYKLN